MAIVRMALTNLPDDSQFTSLLVRVEERDSYSIGVRPILQLEFPIKYCLLDQFSEPVRAIPTQPLVPAVEPSDRKAFALLLSLCKCLNDQVHDAALI
jgi:hypothetical protein